MLNARSAIGEVVELSFQHRFKVLLHLAPGDLHHDAHIHGALWGNLIEGWANDLHFAIHNIFQRGHVQVLKAASILAAEFNAHIVAAHNLAFEGRAVRHRDGHLGHLELDAAHLNAFLHQALGALQVILPFNLGERHADNVFVGGYAGGQNFGDDRVCDDREAKVNGAGRGCIFQIIYLAQGQDKGEDALAVVQQDFARLASLQAAKGEC